MGKPHTRTPKKENPIGSITVTKEKQINLTDNQVQNQEIIQAEKVVKFNLTTKLRDPIWQFIGVALSLILFLIPFLIGFYIGKETKTSPLSIPYNFVSYSNNDFALSLPHTVNQNYIVSSREYKFKLAEDSYEKEPFLRVMVMEGNDIMPSENDFFEDNPVLRERITKAMQFSFGVEEGSGAMKVLSVNPDSYLGHRGFIITLEMTIVDNEKNTQENIAIKHRLLFDKKNKRLYQIFYSPSTITEQIVSTLNLPKAE